MHFVSVKIPNIHHRLRLVRLHGGQYDECCKCNAVTPFWSESKDVPLCLSCADITEFKNIPDKRQWLAGLGYELEDDWESTVAYRSKHPNDEEAA